MTEAELVLEFSENLRFWQKKRNLKNEELANKCGVPRSNLCRWKRGDCYPTARHFVNIVNALNITAAQFWRGEK